MAAPSTAPADGTSTTHQLIALAQNFQESTKDDLYHRQLDVDLGSNFAEFSKEEFEYFEHVLCS